MLRLTEENVHIKESLIPLKINNLIFPPLAKDSGAAGAAPLQLLISAQIKKAHNPKTVRQKTHAPNRRQTIYNSLIFNLKYRDSRKESIVFLCKKTLPPLKKS